MRKITKLFTSISLLFVLLISGLLSCKKETVVQNTVTNTDTVYVDMYTPITAAVISANNWMYKEKRGVRGNSLFYYLRGGSSNTESLDDEFIEYHTDNTATYHEQSGIVRNITWEFNNSENTKMTLHFTNTPANFDIYLDNMRIKDNQFYFDEYYTDGNNGQLTHSQNIKIPKP